jgi:hypothetical protein
MKRTPGREDGRERKPYNIYTAQREMNSAERRGNKAVATAAKSTRRSKRSYTIRTGNKPTRNRRRKKQEKLPRGVRKIAQQEQRAKRAEANGKSNKTKTNLRSSDDHTDSNGHQRQWRKTNTPIASREDMQAMWQHLLLGVGSPSGITRAQP